MEIPVYRPFLDEEEEERIEETLQSGWISQKGDSVENFEERIKNFLEVEHGYATDSGTAALHAALEAVGVEGKDVIVPGLTFGATALAVRQAGGNPKTVDIDEMTLGIDPERLEKRIDGETAAVLLVHLFGQPARIDEIMSIADDHNVPVIEDAAQAFGSAHRGEKLGTIADIGAFSFSWNKTVTTGKGGFIATEDDELGKQIEEMVCNGGSGDRKFSTKGYNYRMDSLRASVGLSQMQKYGEIQERKQRIYRKYRGELEGLEAVDIPERRDTPLWCFYLMSERREEIRSHLEEEGIGSRTFDTPVNQLGIVKDGRDLPVSERVSEKGLVLPSQPGLEDTERICEAIRECLRPDRR